MSRGVGEQLSGLRGICFGRHGPADHSMSAMPLAVYAVTFAIPATYFLEMLRGIVLRGADFFDLLPQTVGLAVCCAVILALSMTRFRKQLG